MKVFTEPDTGKFVIKIPVEWEYRNPILESNAWAPHSFELYDKPKGCFQISCHERNVGQIPSLIKENNLISQEQEQENLKFVERIVFAEEIDMYLWMALIQDDFLLIKYIYDSKKRNSIAIKKEIEKAKDSLKTIMLIKPGNRNFFLTSDRFDKFMSSIAASIDLRNRAYKNGSYIELVVLIANHIDALLRLALILRSQIVGQTNEIDTTLLFQKERDKPVMEKSIYKRAFEENLITKELYDKLFRLYDERNKVVHRYIITDLKTRDVMRIVISYGELQEQIGLIVEGLEQEQFREKIGIYGTNSPPEKLPDEIGMKRIIANVKDKHGHSKYNESITIRE